jgi:hypothetical protein
MTKPAPIPFKPLNFDATAAAVQKLTQSHNIPALTFPQEVRGGEPAPPPPPPPPSVEPVTATPKRAKPHSTSPAKSRRLQRFPVTLPLYVLTEIKQRAIAGETTSRFVIMDALRNSGIHIADDDMIEDGRRVR